MELDYEERYSLDSWERAARKSQHWASTARREADKRRIQRRITFRLLWVFLFVSVMLLLVLTLG